MHVQPRAIAMWDFSWLERRWPGAGYEDWDLVLDELVERGYDAVRIDPYPHLVSAGPQQEWQLEPVWSENNWGAQSRITVRVTPGLIEFVGKARDRGVAVALSSWFRQDVTDRRMQITSASHMAAVWIDTLRTLDEAGLLDNILFVDLCNEFAIAVWAPFLYGTEVGIGLKRSNPRIAAYMAESIELVRAEFPALAYTYSAPGQYDEWRDQDVDALDFLEPHVWMALEDVSDFYLRVRYFNERYSPAGYDNLVEHGRSFYLANQERYDSALFAAMDHLVACSQATGKALVTTECWAVIDYKDWPGLEWDWVLDLNRRAVERAAASGRWIGLATSNFCGPQFRGVWREVEYHQRLTDLIKSSAVDPDVQVPSGYASLGHPMR